MVDFNKLKALGTEFLGKAEALAEQAKEKAGPLAEQAREKAGPLAEKAKDAAVKGTHKAAETLDSRTGGKYSEKIDSVTDKVDTALRKDTAADPAGTGGYAGAATDESFPAGGSDPFPPASSPADGAGDDAGTAAWTDPASVTGVDASGAPADPGWGEDQPRSGGA